jgi:hypothetical protein
MRERPSRSIAQAITTASLSMVSSPGRLSRPLAPLLAETALDALATLAAVARVRKERGDMDGLTAFGLVAVSAMLLFYALEDRSHLVCAGVRWSLHSRIGLWVPAGRLAVRPTGGNLGCSCGSALA